VRFTKKNPVKRTNDLRKNQSVNVRKSIPTKYLGNRKLSDLGRTQEDVEKNPRKFCNLGPWLSVDDGCVCLARRDSELAV